MKLTYWTQKAPPKVATTIQPQEAFDAWFAKHSPKRALGNGRAVNMDARKLRRAAIMRRDGHNMADIGRALGMGRETVRRWLGMLPEGMA